MRTLERLRRVAEAAESGGADYVLVLAGRVASLAAGVAYVAVLSRLYGPSEIAVLAWLAVLSAVVEATKGLGLGTMLLRRLPGLAERTDEQSRAECVRWVGSYWWYTVAPLGLLPVAGAVSGSTIAMAAGASAAMQLAVNGHVLVMQALRRYQAVATAHFGIAVLHRLAPVAIAWQFRLNLEGFLWLQAGTAALLGAVTLASFPSGALGRRTRLGWSEFWPESRFFYGAGILRCAATQIDQILVAALFPAQALATYFLARRLYSGAAAFIDAGVDVTLPQLSLQGARDPRRARIAQARVLRMAMIFAAGAGAIVAANAPAAAQWLFGARYADAAGLMPWLALAAVAYGFYSLSVGGESVLGSPRAAMRWVAAAAVIPLLVVPAGAATLGAATLPLAMTAGYGVAGWGAAVTHSLVRPAADFAALAMGATAAVGAASVGFPLTDLSPTVQTAGLNALAAGSFAAALLLPVRKVAL